MTEKKNHTSNPGVGCDVIACKYNTVDCRCSAERKCCGSLARKL